MAGMGPAQQEEKENKKMATSKCEICGGDYHWFWEEAFSKFGFNDGDGQIETGQVCNALENAGYTVEELARGVHNTIIVSIKKDGIEQIPQSATVGYDDPRKYLPRKIVRLLDKAFPANTRGAFRGASS
jgi:hypothetical protein